jgi:hypothetical protein
MTDIFIIVDAMLRAAKGQILAVNKKIFFLFVFMGFVLFYFVLGFT